MSSTSIQSISMSQSEAQFPAPPESGLPKSDIRIGDSAGRLCSSPSGRDSDGRVSLRLAR